MSLGWLTESSLIPKEPKQIEGVGSGSLLALQAAVYNLERRGPGQTAKAKKRKLETAENDGVRARNAKDEAAHLKDGADLELATAKLREKALKYEAMMAGKERSGEALVNFAEKRFAEGVVPVLPEADLEPEESMPPAGAVHNAIPPPAILRTGKTCPPPEVISAAATGGGLPSQPNLPAGTSEPAPSTVGDAASTTGGASAMVDGGVRQAFERPLMTEGDKVAARRLHEETVTLRETLGKQCREVRQSARERLDALRAARAAKQPAVLEDPASG